MAGPFTRSLIFVKPSRLIYITMRFFSHFEFFIYDKQTRTAYNATKIKGDAKQYNLSLLASYNAARSGHTFYKLLKADALVSFFKQNPGVTVPKELSSFLQGTPDKNRMVMVQYMLKD